MSTLAYSLMAAAGGAGGEDSFVGVIGGNTGVSTNNIYPMFYNSTSSFGRFAVDWNSYRGGGIWSGADGNIMFSTVAYSYQNSAATGNFSCGQAKLNNASSIDPLAIENNHVQFCPPKTPSGGFNIISNPEHWSPIGLDLNGNTIHLIGYGSTLTSAIVKFPDNAVVNGSSATNVKSRWWTNMSQYAGIRDWRTGYDTFITFGRSDIPAGNNCQIMKWDMNNPTGTPDLTFAKCDKILNSGNAIQTTAYNCGDTDTDGNIYAGGGIDNNPKQPFLAKYDSSGAVQWLKESKFGNGQPYGYGSATGLSNIKCSKDGTHLYALQSVFAMQYTTWDGISNTSRKTILTKINPSNGTVLWHRGLRGIADGDWQSGETGLAVDNDGNAYMTVYSMQDNKLDANCADTDYVLIKVNSSGVMQWANVVKADPLNNQAVAASAMGTTDNRRGGFHQQITISKEGEGDNILCSASGRAENSRNVLGFLSVPQDGSGVKSGYSDTFTFSLPAGNLTASSYYKATALEARGLVTLSTLQYNTPTVSQSSSATPTKQVGASNSSNSYATSNSYASMIRRDLIEL
jgi:hypothetical protein